MSSSKFLPLDGITAIDLKSLAILSNANEDQTEAMNSSYSVSGGLSLVRGGPEIDEKVTAILQALTAVSILVRSCWLSQSLLPMLARHYRYIPPQYRTWTPTVAPLPRYSMITILHHRRYNEPQTVKACRQNQPWYDGLENTIQID